MQEERTAAPQNSIGRITTIRHPWDSQLHAHVGFGVRSEPR